MKTVFRLLTSVVIGTLVSGCGNDTPNTSTGPASVDRSRAEDGVGPFARVVTFTTTEPAPSNFESWSLICQTPSVFDPTAKLDFVVVQPDGTQYAQMSIKQILAPKVSRFGRNLAGGDPSVFYGQPIRFQFRTKQGPLTFPPDENGFRFYFFKRNLAGEVDWDKPSHAIKAIIDSTPTADREFSRVVTFKTLEPAPASFDCWQFSWLTPSCYEVDAPLEFAVLDPSGKAYFQLDLTGKLVTPTTSVFKKGVLGGDPAVFFNQIIRFSYRTTKGDLVFPDPQSVKFVFYKKQSEEKSQINQPFKIIDAAMEVTGGGREGSSE